MLGDLSRRDFLKSSAALVAAFSLSSWFPPRRAGAQSRQLPAAPGFTPLGSSKLATGQPIADISTGWDGTQWAVDTLGIPHVYDPLQQSWQAFGKGVDAATKIGENFYLFRGEEMAIYNPAQGLLSINKIGAQWPGLPATFQSDLDGAFANGQILYLCRSGRTVSADLSKSPVAFSQPAPLNSWPGWPTDNPWASGVVSKACTWIDSVLPAALFLPVQTPPLSFAAMFLIPNGAIDQESIADLGIIIPPTTSQVADMLKSGDFDAYVTQTNGARIPNAHWVFQGPIVWTQSTSDQNTSATTPNALSTWVPDWQPTLSHAPRGRVGNLWSVTTGGAVVYHDGEQWNQAPAIAGANVLNVDVGEDGVPFALATGAGGAALHRFDASTNSWQAPLALGGITAQQVTVGDQTRVYVLDSSGNVHKLDGGSFTQVSQLAGVSHLTANHDGTVWHSNGSANAFRFISEQAYPPETLPIASTVQKVASTAYGNALLLVNQGGANQLYSYKSPVLFKTSPSYVPVANGVVLQNPQVTPGGARAFVNFGSGIVALDSHTGEQLWSATLPNQGECASIVYDPIHELIYATDGHYTLFALQASTGAPFWEFGAYQPISQPALSGTGLCLVGATNVYWIDTSTAFGQAMSNQPVTAKWVTTLETYDELSYASVFIDASLVYISLIVSDIFQTRERVWRVNALDGSAPTLMYDNILSGEGGIGWNTTLASVIGRSGPADAPSRMMFTNIGYHVQLFTLTPGTGYQQPNAPPANGFTQGIAYYENIIYAPGSDGVLYALNMNQVGQGFAPVPLQTPTNGATFGAGPILAASGEGALIAFSLTLGGANSICLYDPTTGNLLQLQTDHLLATQLVVDGNGILYAAGLDPADPNSPFGQVYAIRIDDLLQQERAFVIESELMQDFDEPASGQLAATARYQTHVTIVGAMNRAQPFQAVKVWADTDTLTTVQIDGVAHQIDATTPALVQTDATGMVTIVTDATDLSTTALKVWAGFMNPYERIVVYPDREFHNRLATTHYTSTTSPDPNTINLATASTYTVTNLNQPPPLLYTTQAQQQGAQVSAPVIQQVAQSVSYPGGAVQGGSRYRSRTASNAPYLAGVFAGAFYAPVSSPADRQVAPLAMTGLSIDFTAYQSQGGPPVYTTLSVADAANAIDGISTPGDMAVQVVVAPDAFSNWWSDLWADIKSGVAIVTRVVVSIGRDIYLGLKYLVQGVEYVLKQALHDIEEVAVAIGSVLAALGRLIHDVIEGISLIFHLEKVWETYTLLKNYVTGWVQTTLPQTIAAQESKISSALETLETDITTNLNKLITILDAGQVTANRATTALPIQNMQGMGATTQTAFTVTPTGGKPSMMAVPAMWGTHKLRNNLAQSTVPALPGSSVPNFIGEFISSFISDPDLQSALSNAGQQFDKSLHPTSAKAFFGMLLGDLLEIVELVAVAAIDGIKAGVTTLMTNIGAVVSALGSLGSADIPILSTILRLLGLGNVTILDILLFIAAIPITLVYRIAYGAYPADSVKAGALAASTLSKVAGLMSGIMNIISGIFGAISDAMDVANVNVSDVGKIVKHVVGITIVVLTAASYIVGDVASPSFGTIFASVINILQGMLGLWSPDSADAPSLALVPSIFGAMMAAPLLLFAYVEAYEEDQDVVSLIANVISTLSLIVNPLKYAKGEIAVIPPIVDVVAGLVSGELTIVNTFASTLPPPTALPEADEPAVAGSHRVFMPTILQGQ